MRGYFQHIELKYNNEVLKTMKEYCNETKRLIQQQQRLKFLLESRSYGITPKHIKNTTTHVKKLFQCNTTLKKLTAVENNFHQKILNLEISQTNNNIKIIRRKVYQLKVGIQNLIPSEESNSFIQNQTRRLKYVEEKVKTTQNRKLNTLKEKYFKLHGFVYNENWFVNKTTLDVPNECKWITSLGKKFSLPIRHKTFSPIHTIADLEQYIQTIEDNMDKEIIRTQLGTNISKYKRNIRSSPREKFITAAYEKTKRFFFQHKDIILTQSDKGNKTVIMKKEEYNDKMKILLEDKNTYRPMRSDPTEALQKENNKIVSDLYKKNSIDTILKKQLHCPAAIAPRIYGLPKIHKPNMPLRPIVASTNVPCYQLSKHIGQLIKNIVSPEYNIKNSEQLKEQLKVIKLEKDEIFVSFDAVSLFTNIPVNLAIKNIMKNWNKIENDTKIPKTSFLKILQFCLIDNNYFKYDGKIYNQVFGMPMGNPLSPTIADVILDNILDEVLTELNNKNITLKYIVKYVDDILAIVKIDDIDEILKTLNKYHPKIQFTAEVENERKIAYLDTMIIRENDKILMDWYTKDIASGRLMNFHATQPRSQIINTAKSFICRVLRISDEQFHTKNINKIKTILGSNSFPLKLIDNLIYMAKLNTARNNTDHNTTEPKQFHSVTFIPGLTDNHSLKSTLKINNVNFAYKPNGTLNNIFTKTKDRVEKNKQHNVVYEIKCNGNNQHNCDLIYIGTTKRTVETRMREHQNDITKKKETTALTKHILESGHTINFDDVKIIDRESKGRKRYTLESLHIQQNINRTMNLKEDTDNISSSYRVALKTNGR